MPTPPTGQPLAVSAIGAATALGGAVQAAAAARASLSRPSVIPGCLALDPETNEPVPVTGLAATPVTEGFEGVARLERLGEAALEDLLASAPRVDPARTAVLVALPRGLGEDEGVAEEPAPREPAGAAEEDAGAEEEEAAEEEGAAVEEDDEQQPPEPPERAAARLVEQLLEGAGLSLPATSIQCLLDERSGTTQALQRAAALLGARQVDAVLLLAMDSLADPPRAERLMERRRLKTPEHPTGFLPGEAAVALLLERAESPRGRQQLPAALLAPPIVGLEPRGAPDAEAPPTGRVLHEVLAAALAGSGAPGGGGGVYVDLNGESRRAQEWGNVLVHARRSSRLDLWDPRLPALAFGETGAASPLLSVLLAVRAFARGRTQEDRALVAVVGEDGHRAAFVVRRAAATSR